MTSGATSVAELVRAYDPAFLATMSIPPAEVSDSAALLRAITSLDGPARGLAETLLLAVGPGESVPERFRTRVDKHGDPLWKIGFLLPRVTPSPGATIDPRHYAGACRLNGALVGVPLFEDALLSDTLVPHSPASDAAWDAIVVACAFEAEPPALTREGIMRKDVERRLLASFGPDETRWTLAMAMARATGLIRPAGKRLYGFPESNPRPLTDAVSLLEGGAALAAGVLLRLVGPRWVHVPTLIDQLGARCPDLFETGALVPWDQREAVWLREAADMLHRAGVIDATRGPAGIEAIRLGTPRPPRPSGFMLTPDRDILIAPWELPGPEYGRLCRMAPYQDGDVVHRHKLTSDGVAADLASGYDDTRDWLTRRSRTGLPSNVAHNLDEWARSAVRVTLFSGVTVLERADGSMEIGPEQIPADARMLYYDEPPPAKMLVQDGVVVVPFGQDALTVRAAVDRLGPPLEPTDRGFRWKLAPPPIHDPDHVLDQLRRYHDGELPGEVEAAVHAAAGRNRCGVEEAVVLHLPAEAAAALRRDRVAAVYLGRQLVPGQCVVDRRDLGALEHRLRELGFELGQG